MSTPTARSTAIKTSNGPTSESVAFAAERRTTAES